MVESIQLNITADQSTTDSLPLGTFVNLEVAATGSSTDGGIFTWSNGQTGLSTTDTLLIVPCDTVNVTLQTPLGCTYEDEIVFKVKDIGFGVPNIFTPNGDNISDYFNAVYSSNVEIIEFKIWNRWGQEVFNNEDPINGWDGRKDEKDVPSDVYFYHIRLQNPAGVITDYAGDLTLVR